MATDNFSFAENEFRKKRLIEKTQSIFLKLINFIKATHIYKNKKKKGLILFQYSVLNGMLIYIYMYTTLFIDIVINKLPRQPLYTYIQVFRWSIFSQIICKQAFNKNSQINLFFAADTQKIRADSPK